MFDKFNSFLINNFRTVGRNEETFSDFTSFNEALEEEDVVKYLQTITNHINNSRGVIYYRNLISFHILKSNNTKIVKKNLKNLVSSKGKRSKWGKIAKRFYIISKYCEKDSWKKCDIGPSYFTDLNKDKWEELLIKFDIEESEDSEDE